MVDPASLPEGPPNVTLWTALSTAGSGMRDFRMYSATGKTNVTWHSAPLAPEPGGGTWIGRAPVTPGRWTAFFLQAAFPGPRAPVAGQPSPPYVFATQASVVPNTLPFPPCGGAACRGTLV